MVKPNMKKSFFSTSFFLSIVLSGTKYSQKISKNETKIYFFVFGCHMKNAKRKEKNQIWFKLIRNLCIFKLIYLYIIELRT